MRKQICTLVEFHKQNRLTLRLPHPETENSVFSGQSRFVSSLTALTFSLKLND